MRALFIVHFREAKGEEVHSAVQLIINALPLRERGPDIRCCSPITHFFLSCGSRKHPQLDSERAPQTAPELLTTLSAGSIQIHTKRSGDTEQ